MHIYFLQKDDAEQASKLFKDNVEELKYYKPRARKTFEKIYSPKNLQKKIGKKSYILLVAKDKGLIVGISFGFLDYDVAFRDWTLVQKDYRRKGIGTHLVKKFESICEKLKIHK